MYFFFVKQKTAYEMRISDWSSDVCSSDLQRRRREIVAAQHIAERAEQQRQVDVEHAVVEAEGAEADQHHDRRVEVAVGNVQKRHPEADERDIDRKSVE